MAGQTLSFLYAIALGAGLGLFYDLFRILRIALPHRPVAVAAEDVFFWTASAFFTFLFFFCTDGGRIRIFLLIGQALGFTLWYFTLGILVIGAAKRIIAVIRWIFSWLYRLFVRPVLYIFGYLGGFLGAAAKSAGNLAKKRLKNSNRHLQKYRSLLYNQRKHLKGRFLHKSQKKDRVANEKSEDSEKS